MAFDGSRWPEYYRHMYRIRRFEEMAAVAYQDTLVRGSLHLTVGEEAIAVGATGALRPDDLVTTSYRSHGHALAKGSPPGPLFAELFGRRTGVCKGKGGSMHFIDVAHGIIAATAIVAAQVPMAVGAALAAERQGTGRVVLTYFGDGAINQGAFHEAANLAAIWKAPVILVCENNGFSEMSPTSPMLSVPHPVDRAACYGMPGERVDGNDVEAVYTAVARAVERARSGAGPSFIEAETYRFVGHMFGDPEDYRSAEEVQERRKHDPVVRARATLVQRKIDPAPIEAEVESELEQAYAFAEASPWPDPAEVEEDVYAD